MAEATTFNVPIAREDLADLISMVDPQNSPIYSSAEKVSADGALHEWAVDNLQAPSFGGVREDVDYSTYTNQMANLDRINNRIQIFDETYQVSNVLRKVEVAGMADSLAYVKRKAIVQIKRDQEAAFASDNEMVAGATGVAPVARGLGVWLQSTAQSVNPVGTAFLTPAASIYTGAVASFTEASLQTLLQSQYNVCGTEKQNTAYVGSILKTTITNFTQSGATDNNRYTADQSKGEIARAVDIYRGDFGQVDIVPDLFLGLTTGQAPSSTAQSQKRGYIIPDGFLQVASLALPLDTANEDKGAGPRGFFRCTSTLVMKNPLIGIKIAPSS